MSWLAAVQRQVEIRNVLLTLADRAVARSDEREVQRLSDQITERNRTIARLLARANVPREEWGLYGGVNPDIGPHEEHIHYPWPDPPSRKPPRQTEFGGPYTPGMALADWFINILSWFSVRFGWPTNLDDEPGRTNPPPNKPVDLGLPTFGPPPPTPERESWWTRMWNRFKGMWGPGGD